jgi:8-oxo-dGTP pyrophosphatase MutT (NUDIX family)
MKKSFWCLLCIWLFLLMSQKAIADCGAGTVLYFTSKGETYLLLADHNWPRQRDRGWSGFGGLCDGDPANVAAARETEEETKGFYSRGQILAMLGSSPKIRAGDFTTFFVEVDYVPAIVFNNQNPSNHGVGHYERGPYAWIPISEIFSAIEKRQSGRMHIPGKYLPPSAQTNWLFEPFVTSLMAAKKAGVLPWDP